MRTSTTWRKHKERSSGAVHPFDEEPNPFASPPQRITDELPVDVALGKLDYMEIVGFSDHKSTAAVWYRLLNLGFKNSCCAGTDATTNYAAPIRAWLEWIASTCGFRRGR